MVEETLMRVLEKRRKEPKYILPILLGILALLNLVDWIMTDYALSKGATELNPISKWLIAQDMFDETKFGGIILSTCALGLFGWLESKYVFERDKWIYYMFSGIILAAVISYIVVLVNNVMQLKKLGGE